MCVCTCVCVCVCVPVCVCVCVYLCGGGVVPLIGPDPPLSEGDPLQQRLNEALEAEPPAGLLPLRRRQEALDAQCLPGGSGRTLLARHNISRPACCSIIRLARG